ncbi:MAG: hypothetical protein UE295_06565 [Acutalibacteraceae bacterium]|nr:hypothetical protein [Acutalibacteraceae bacterium]
MIDIKDIIPFMRDGWVAMDKDKEWWWYSEKPFICGEQWHTEVDSSTGTGMIDNSVFDIPPADDWTKSLIKVGGK